MLDDILKSINNAEAEADRILKEAEAQAAALLTDARAKAQSMKEDALAETKARSQEQADALQAEGGRQLEDAAEKAREEVSALKALIAPKRKAAAEAVIQSLI